MRGPFNCPCRGGKKRQTPRHVQGSPRPETKGSWRNTRVFQLGRSDNWKQNHKTGVCRALLTHIKKGKWHSFTPRKKEGRLLMNGVTLERNCKQTKMHASGEPCVISWREGGGCLVSLSRIPLHMLGKCNLFSRLKVPLPRGCQSNLKRILNWVVGASLCHGEGLWPSLFEGHTWKTSSRKSCEVRELKI